MKFSKKMMAALLAACMMAGALAGCGNEEGQGTAAPANGTETVGQDANGSGGGSDGSADAADSGAGDEADSEALGGVPVDWEDDPAEVTWMMWNVGGVYTPEGVQAVEDAINEITLNKINVQVNLEVLEMGTYISQMPMQVGANDKIDLISTFPAGAGNFNTMVNSGQLLPLDDLLADYAPETLELLPSTYLDATTVDGSIYGVPVYTDNTNDLYWICRESYLTEAGFSVDDIHSYEDITRVFEAVHELHPEMKMISSGAKNLLGSSGTMLTGAAYDDLGTSILAVFPEGDSAKVVNLYETEEYQEAAAVLYEWEQKGYIDSDIMIREDDPSSDDTVFSYFLAGNRSRTSGNEALAGEPLVSVKLAEGYVSTGTMAIMTTAIPVCATEPEAAARLLNLCYTDKDLKMLASYGLEGENYTYDDQGGLVVNTDSSYAPNTVGIFGNVMLCDQTATDAALNYKSSDIDQTALLYSPLLGFSVDTDPITNEAAQISSVFTEYQALVNCGLADENTYQEFIDKLYSSGLERYIEEIQSQLDAWFAENN